MNIVAYYRVSTDKKGQLNSLEALFCRYLNPKAMGIETQFLTANMTSMDNSEFVLTVFGALAQEESNNTSKRVKFSNKKINTEKGISQDIPTNF